MLCFVFAALVVLLDQLFKRWVVLTHAVGEETVIIRGLVNLRHEVNNGAAFSILPNQRWLLAAIAFVAAIVLIAILLRYSEGFWGTLGLASVLGGAVGNLIDRVFHGHVVDMFKFTFMDFAIFNIADIFITLGMITFCIFFIVTSFRSGGTKEKSTASGPDEYDNAGIEQYDRRNYIREPQQAPEAVDYNELFYGDTIPDTYPESDFAPPPEYFEPDQAQQQAAPAWQVESAQSFTQEQNGFCPAAPEAPVYYEPAGSTDHYEAAPEQQSYYMPKHEPAADITPTLEALGSLGALSALESELNETDLLAEYDIDDILREYGFEDDKN